MRTNQSTVVLLLAAALCGFFFGLGRHHVMAAVTNCSASSCEDEYSWWNNGSPALSAQILKATYPFAQGDNTTQASPLIFVAVASGTKTPLKQAGNFDLWQWPNSTASCQNADGSLPSPQMVIVSAPGMLKPTQSLPNAGRTTCTPKS